MWSHQIPGMVIRSTHLVLKITPLPPPRNRHFFSENSHRVFWLENNCTTREVLIALSPWRSSPKPLKADFRSVASTWLTKMPKWIHWNAKALSTPQAPSFVAVKQGAWFMMQFAVSLFLIEKIKNCSMCLLDVDREGDAVGCVNMNERY